jgi:UDP-2,3-diacylglucosamine hydrolase
MLNNKIIHNKGVLMTDLMVSDLHLDESRPGLTDIFFRFLRGDARKASALYLLGDVFEVWVGDDDDAPLVDEVAKELKAVSDGGTTVYFMHGNRDFLVGVDYALRAGMTLLQDPVVHKVGGVETLLTHGDRYCTDDAKYQAVRAQLRSPAFQSMILAKTLDERRAIAASARAQSIAHQKATGALPDVGDVVSDALVKEMGERGVRRLIHGHTHRPDVHTLTLADGSSAERIVLADWREYGEALEIRDDGTYFRIELR